MSVSTIKILFVIEGTGILLKSYFDGAFKFQTPDDFLAFLGLVLWSFAFSMWIGNTKKAKDPFLPTMFGIFFLVLCLIGFNSWIWAISFGALLLMTGYLLYAKILPFFEGGFKNGDDGIPSDDSRYISSEVKKTVWERDGGKCVICGSRRQLEYDHNIPHSKGGGNGVNNIRILCKECNRKKRDRIE